MPARLEIDVASPVPVIRQIVDQLRTRLVEGAVRPGEALPSVRRLAIDLGVHFNTVAEAYRALAEEGWLDVQQGRSVRVRERTKPAPLPATRERFRQRLRQLVADARAQGLSAAAVARDLVATAGRLRS